MSDDRRPGPTPADPAIDAAWRRASDDEPSARADAAILAAARTAARSTARGGPVVLSKRRRWAEWRPMAAAAAVAALALLLVPRAEREEARLDAPMRAPVHESSAPAVEMAPTPVPARSRGAKSAEKSTLPATAPAAQGPQGVPQRAAEPVPLEARPVDAEARAEAAAPGPAVAPPHQVATAATDVSGGGIGPQQWVDRVAALHAAGDLTGAAAALHGFRRAYPDADSYLPPALVDWAAGVPKEP